MTFLSMSPIDFGSSNETAPSAARPSASLEAFRPPGRPLSAGLEPRPQQIKGDNAASAMAVQAPKLPPAMHTMPVSMFQEGGEDATDPTVKALEDRVNELEAKMTKVVWKTLMWVFIAVAVGVVAYAVARFVMRARAAQAMVFETAPAMVAMPPPVAAPVQMPPAQMPPAQMAPAPQPPTTAFPIATRAML